LQEREFSGVVSEAKMLRLGVVLAVLAVALAEPTTYFKEQFEDGAFA